MPSAGLPLGGYLGEFSRMWSSMRRYGHATAMYTANYDDLELSLRASSNLRVRDWYVQREAHAPKSNDAISFLFL